MIRNQLLLTQSIPLPSPQYQITPEKRLMLAILQDAVACLEKGLFRTSHRCSRPAYEAAQWIAQRDRTWLFSFENICDNLNLDAEALRQRLLRKEWYGLRQGIAQHENGNIATPSSRTKNR
ncbi:MAG TPA: hypothetical protein VGX03_23505 [Candidatus Binatia bacterium]|jgi:hypothetical protein|nr:hypothetical protein [Candidatus Binatia bacterium]